MNRMSGGGRGVTGEVRSGPFVGGELVFDEGDAILENQLAFLQPSQHQLVLPGSGDYPCDGFVQVAVLDAQFAESQVQGFGVFADIHWRMVCGKPWIGNGLCRK